MLDVAQETISGHRIVKAFGMEQFERGRFLDASRNLASTQAKYSKTVYLSSPILELLGIVIAAGYFLYGRQVIATDEMSIGAFVAYIIAMMQMYDPLRKLSRTQNFFQHAFAAMSRIQVLLDIHTEKQDQPGAVELAPLGDRVTFRGVSFKYSDSPDWILRDVSLEVKRGEVVALVGLSGAGKTTLTNLLMRIYDPTLGEILIVVSKMKKYIRDRSGMNTSDAVANALGDHVRAVCDEAIRAAARDGRKTVLDRDVPRLRG